MSCGRFQGPSKLKCKNTRVRVGPLRQWDGNGEMMQCWCFFFCFRVYFKRGEGKKENMSRSAKTTE